MRKGCISDQLARGGWDSGIGEDLFLLIAVDLMPWQLRKKLPAFTTLWARERTEYWDRDLGWDLGLPK